MDKKVTPTVNFYTEENENYNDRPGTVGDGIIISEKNIRPTYNGGVTDQAVIELPEL